MRALVFTLACVFAVLAARPAGADYGGRHGSHGKRPFFQRIATFSVYRNNEDITQETVAEIVAATRNGRTLVYTDSKRGAIGLLDISYPHHPKPLGTVAVGGEPTSVG